MSMDSGDPGMENPVAGISQPKSNKKLWIYGGLGCFGLIGLVCVGCTVLGFVMARPTMNFMNENNAFVQSSQDVQDVLGSPITLGPPQVENQPPKIIITAEISGPKGSGTYVLEGTMEGFTPVRDAIYIEVNGERIDLDPENELNFTVDDGA